MYSISYQLDLGGSVGRGEGRRLQSSLFAGIRTSPSHSIHFITVYVKSKHPVGAALAAPAFPWWFPWNPSPPFRYPTHATILAWHGCSLLLLSTHSWHTELTKLVKWRESIKPMNTAQSAPCVLSGIRRTRKMRIAIDLIWRGMKDNITSLVLSNMNLFTWTKTMGQYRRKYRWKMQAVASIKSSSGFDLSQSITYVGSIWKCLRSTYHPACAYRGPLIFGLCISSFVSQYLWCLRWIDAHQMRNRVVLSGSEARSSANDIRRQTSVFVDKLAKNCDKNCDKSWTQKLWQKHKLDQVSPAATRVWIMPHQPFSWHTQ